MVDVATLTCTGASANSTSSCRVRLTRRIPFGIRCMKYFGASCDFVSAVCLSGCWLCGCLLSGAVTCNFQTTVYLRVQGVSVNVRPTGGLQNKLVGAYVQIRTYACRRGLTAGWWPTVADSCTCAKIWHATVGSPLLPCPSLLHTQARYTYEFVRISADLSQQSTDGCCVGQGRPSKDGPYVG